MAQPQHTLAPILPMEAYVEIDAPRVRAKTHMLLNTAPGRFDVRMGDNVPVFARLDPRLAPFQIGDLVFPRRLEHAITRVPVGLQRDVRKAAVRQSADQ